MKRPRFLSKSLTSLILSLVVLFFSIVQISFFPSGALEGERIEETEAKELLYRAFCFYSKYQAAPDGSKITTTKTAMSSEARSIYSEEIADSMWNFDFPWAVETRFTENPDGTISFRTDHYAQGILYSCYVRYSSNYKENRPSSANDMILRNLSDNAAEVMLYKNSMEESTPVWVSVTFANGANGWRICGGNLTHAFADYWNPDMVYSEALSRFCNVVEASCTAAYALAANDPDDVYREQPKGSEEWFNKIKDFFLLYADETRCVYTFVLSKNGKRYDAEFTYDPDFTYKARAEYHTGARRLTGGGIYELSTAKTDVAEWTGDVNSRTVFVSNDSSTYTGDVILWEVCAYSAVALLCLSACVISKRKRLKTPL